MGYGLGSGLGLRLCAHLHALGRLGRPNPNPYPNPNPDPNPNPNPNPNPSPSPSPNLHTPLRARPPRPCSTWPPWPLPRRAPAAPVTYASDIGLQPRSQRVAAAGTWGCSRCRTSSRRSLSSWERFSWLGLGLELGLWLGLGLGLGFWFWLGLGRGLGLRSVIVLG